MLFSLASMTDSARADAQMKDFDRAISSFEQGDYETGDRLLKKLVAEKPDNALFWFNFGNCEYKEKRLASALLAWKKVIELNSPLAPAAKLYIAEALMEMHQNDEAAKYHSIIYQQTLPGELRQQFDDQEVRLAGYSKVAQNAYSANPSQSWSSVVNASYGARSATGYGNQEVPMGSGYLEYMSAQRVGGVYEFAWDEFIGTDRLLTQSLMGKAEIQEDGARFTVYPGVSYELLSSNPFALKPFLNLQADRKIGRFWTGALLMGSRSLMTDPNYAYLTGNSLLGKIYGYFPVSKAWVGAALYGGSDTTGDLPVSDAQLPYSNRSLGVELNVAVALVHRVSLTGNTSYFHRWFDQSPAESAPPSDNTISAALSVAYQIDKSLSANVAESAVWNRASTSAIFVSTQYNEFRTLAGISWSPFGSR